MSVAITKGIFIVAAKRTPFGKLGGKFVNKSSSDLQEVVAKAALVAGGLKPEQIDSVVIGNCLTITSSDGIFLPRHVLLRTGIPLDRPALGINYLCGSGFQAIVNGAQNILVGDSQIVLTGGVEALSQAPFVARNIRFGTTLGKNYVLTDSLWDELRDTYCNMPMAITAEILGAKYGIKREESDAFALRSQQLWKVANDAGYFKEELTPVTVQIKKKNVVVDVDEHPRPQTTADDLAKLPTPFKENGLVTAGSTAGISDGAGAVILASEEAVKSQGLKPLARLVGYNAVGVEPSIKGIASAPSIRNLLKVTGKTLNDMDLIEINEAYSAQALACAKDLELDVSKLNVNGGGIAMGHPFSASGARITSHMVHELRRRKAKFGIGSTCIGGGQGIAILIEAV